MSEEEDEAATLREFLYDDVPSTRFSPAIAWMRLRARPSHRIIRQRSEFVWTGEDGKRYRIRNGRTYMRRGGRYRRV